VLVYLNIVTHVPIARQRLSIHVPVKTQQYELFSVDLATTRCWVTQQYSTGEDGVFHGAMAL
jgi:hypothetical protein